MRAWRRVMVALLGFVMLPLLVSCTLGDDAIRVLGRQVGKLDEVAERVPKSRLPNGVTTTRAAVEEAIASIMARVDVRDPTERKRVVKAACIASDLSQVNSFDKAVEFGIQQTDTSAARKSQVESLTRDLVAADSSGEQARILAKAAICTWADST